MSWTIIRAFGIACTVAGTIMTALSEGKLQEQEIKKAVTEELNKNKKIIKK